MFSKIVMTVAITATNLLTSQPVVYQAVYEPIKVVIKEVVDDVDKVDFYANNYGVDANLMRKVIDCENKDWDTNLQSRYKYPRDNTHWGVKAGETEKSFGLAQIHLPDWPDITKEQAKDPDFALNFMAKKFSEDKEELWSCYNLLKKQGKLQ